MQQLSSQVSYLPFCELEPPTRIVHSLTRGCCVPCLTASVQSNDPDYADLQASVVDIAVRWPQ